MLVDIKMYRNCVCVLYPQLLVHLLIDPLFSKSVYLILKCVFVVFYYITIINASIVLLVTMLVTTITILSDLTIELFIKELGF